MLFIIQHQTSELWMKLAIHELNAACRLVAADDLAARFQGVVAGVAHLEQLNSAWDVLRTMTPSEYTEFRGALGQSSGLQSWQYRMIEFLVGNKNAAMTQSPREATERSSSGSRRHRQAPSIYDLTIRLLSSARLPGRSMPSSNATSRMPHVEQRQRLAPGWSVYRDPARFWELYELAEKLVDFEDYFRRWRFNHVTTVERVIGFKRGTGGTSGVSYLRKMLEVVLFPELWQVRTQSCE